MKKLICLGIIFALSLINCLLPSEVHGNNWRSPKLTDRLYEVIEGITEDEGVMVYVVLKDIDSNTVMDRFSNEYPEEYNEYVRSKEDGYDLLEFSLVNSAEKITSCFADRNINDILLQNAIETKRSLYADLYTEQNQSFADRIADKDQQLFVSKYSPLLILKICRTSILSLCNEEMVVYVDYFEELQPIDYLATANEVTQAAYVRDTYGNKGSGVKIGQIESHIPDYLLLSLSSIIIDPAVQSESNIQDHATIVALIMVGPNYGVAPEATLYATCTNNFSNFFTRVEWLINQGVNIINMSFGFGSSGAYNDYSAWIDHIAMVHDVHVVIASGNPTQSDPSLKINNLGMAYNAITVGAFNDNNTVSSTDDTLCAFSSYIENSNSTHGEKPNLVAPGENITVGMYQDSGTSFSAPQVSGIIAQLCSYNTYFRTKQSTVGAMLEVASASKLSGFSSNLISGSTQINNKQGAGKLNAKKLRAIASTGNYWRKKIAASNFPYSQTISLSADPNSSVRIAIFWLVQHTLGDSHLSNVIPHPLTNLNLKVYAPDGSLVASSTTTYSNYEIVQFTPAQTGTYTIKILKATSGTTIEEVVGIAVWH